MFQKLRSWIKAFVSLDLLFTVMYSVVAVVFGTLCLLVVLISGEQKNVLPLLMTVTATVASLGFFSWLYVDARRASQALRLQRRQAKGRRQQEVSEVAGVSHQPPWLG